MNAMLIILLAIWACVSFCLWWLLRLPEGPGCAPEKNWRESCFRWGLIVFWWIGMIFVPLCMLVEALVDLLVRHGRCDR